MKKNVSFIVFFLLFFFGSNAFANKVFPTDENEVNKSAYDLINVKEMWEAGYTGEGVNIAVIDTGLGYVEGELHPDLNADKILIQLNCNNYFEECVDADGFEDVGNSNHGTHVVGLINAKHDNVGMKGIAPNANILIFQTGPDFNVLGSSYFYYALSTIYEYNKTATNDRKIHIINVSKNIALPVLGTDELINKLYSEQGVLIVAAGGNLLGEIDELSQIAYPARLDSVIGVANVNNNGSRYIGKEPEFGSITGLGGSLTGKGLDIAAPGVDLWSTITSERKNSEGLNQNYEDKYGTSQSAPIVTGYLALLKEQFPNDSAQALRKKLLFNTVPRPGETGSGSNIPGNLEYGNGILQAVPYGVKSTVTVKSNTEFYKIPHVDYLSTYKVSRDTEMKVYLEWKNPMDSTDAWLKLENGLWIKSSILQIVGEPIEERSIYVNEETKAYAFPWEDGNTIDLSDHVVPGIYPSTRGYIEIGANVENIKVKKNYLWYSIKIGEQVMWVKEKPIYKLKNIQYMTFHKNDLVYDQPSFSSSSQTVSELGNPKGVTKYSYDGYDYNENEKRFKWYSFSTSNGLKWYPSVYEPYNADKLPESNGFEDGMITSWNDYINSDFVHTWKKEMVISPTWAAQFEERNLFAENDFNEIHEIYKHYKYHTISTLTHLQYGDRAVRLFFSNSPLYVDNNGSFPYYKTIDGSEFIMLYPSKNANDEKRYSTTRTKSSQAGSSRPDKFEINLYELNLK